MEIKVKRQIEKNIKAINENLNMIIDGKIATEELQKLSCAVLSQTILKSHLHGGIKYPVL